MHTLTNKHTVRLRARSRGGTHVFTHANVDSCGVVANSNRAHTHIQACKHTRRRINSSGGGSAHTLSRTNILTHANRRANSRGGVPAHNPSRSHLFNACNTQSISHTRIQRMQHTFSLAHMYSHTQTYTQAHAQQWSNSGQRRKRQNALSR